MGHIHNIIGIRLVNTMNIKKIKLGENSFTYIRDELAKGGYLSKYLLNTELEKGTVYTYIPIGISLDHITDYGQSLHYLTGESVYSEIHDYIYRYISEYLDQGQNRCVIFETLGLEKDLLITKVDIQFFLSHSRIYGLLRGSDEFKPIKKYLRHVGGYPTIIICADIQGSKDLFVQASELKGEIYLTIVNNVDSLIIGAFDVEGYLIWCKQGDD